MTETVVIAGQGYVGLPLAVRAAESGHFHVVGYDVDAARVKRLAAGESYVEDVPSERLAAVLAAGTYRPTADVRDLRRLRRRGDHGADPAAGRAAGPQLHRGGGPHAGAAPAAGLHGGAGVDHLPGHHRGAGRAAAGGGLRAARRPRLPPRLQPGADRPGQPRLGPGEHAQGGLRDRRRRRWPRSAAFYDRVVDTHRRRCRRPKVAELAKLLENTFRHVNIALVNELAMFAHDLGIDVWEAIDAASTKPFGFMRFTPGPGGRRALPADRPVYLSWQVSAALGQPVPVRRAGQRRQRPHARLRRAAAHGGAQPAPPGGQRLPGAAARPGVQEATPATPGSPRRCGWPSCCSSSAPRCAPPTRTWSRPIPVDRRLVRVELTADELAAADAVVVLTDHDGFD